MRERTRETVSARIRVCKYGFLRQQKKKNIVSFIFRVRALNSFAIFPERSLNILGENRVSEIFYV